MRQIWLAFAALVMAFPAWAETRLALVIDQTNYAHTAELSRVALADTEADLIHAALTDTGFKVTRVSDRTKQQLIDALDEFRIRLEKAGSEAVGFVYYTGHGAQHPQSRSSYLLGTDARMRSDSDLAAYGIDLEAQRDGFAATGAKAVFLVFDACRNVATGSGYKANVKGISRVNPKADMLIAYSTDLDDVAEEGVYAPVLAEEIRRPGQTAEALFASVQQRVASATQRKQRPWYNPRLYNKVCFSGCDISPAQTVAAVSPPKLANPTVAATVLARLVNPGFRFRDGRWVRIDSYAIKLETGKLARLEAELEIPINTRVLVSSIQGDTFRLSNADAPQRLDVFRDTLSGGGQGPEMVLVGEEGFLMGSPPNEDGREDDEGPQRTVTIGYPLLVGKYEVTWAQYSACATAGYCPTPPVDKFGKGSRPVTNVSWHDAKKYAAWLSKQTGKTYRLLTEAEWEYAARAATTTPFSFGQTITAQQANFFSGDTGGAVAFGTARGQTEPVGIFPPNAFGLHEMHGNVWEWVEDCYEAGYSVQLSNGSAYNVSPCAERVIRGGSWIDGPNGLRSADRSKYAPDKHGYLIGFRVARTVP